MPKPPRFAGLDRARHLALADYVRGLDQAARY